MYKHIYVYTHIYSMYINVNTQYIVLYLLYTVVTN